MGLDVRSRNSFGWATALNNKNSKVIPERIFKFYFDAKITLWPVFTLHAHLEHAGVTAACWEGEDGKDLRGERQGGHLTATRYIHAGVRLNKSGTKQPDALSVALARAANAKKFSVINTLCDGCHGYNFIRKCFDNYLVATFNIIVRHFV